MNKDAARCFRNNGETKQDIMRSRLGGRKTSWGSVNNKINWRARLKTYSNTPQNGANMPDIVKIDPHPGSSTDFSAALETKLVEKNKETMFMRIRTSVWIYTVTIGTAGKAASLPRRKTSQWWMCVSNITGSVSPLPCLSTQSKHIISSSTRLSSLTRCIARLSSLAPTNRSTHHCLGKTTQTQFPGED